MLSAHSFQPEDITLFAGGACLQVLVLMAGLSLLSSVNDHDLASAETIRSLCR